MFIAPVEAAITAIPALTGIAGLPLRRHYRRASTIVTTGAISCVTAPLNNSTASSGNSSVLSYISSKAAIHLRLAHKRCEELRANDIKEPLEGDGGPFRDADRSPAPDTLTLHLHDFAPDTLCQGCPNLPLPISHHDMSDMMAKAERSMELRKRRKDRTPKRITKRRYVESSEDKMGTDDEKRCSQEADNANDKGDGDNGAYKPQES
ncbi:hypothetical protein ACKLNR_013960 [Fusarium oxysporum f. sp. zingiberi]